MKIMMVPLVVAMLVQVAVSAPGYGGFVAPSATPDYSYAYSGGVANSQTDSFARGSFAYAGASGQEPVHDTPEVVRARQEHLAAVAQAKQGVQPIADTPEVADARARHLAILHDTQARVTGVAVLPPQGVAWGVSSTPTPVQDTVEVAAAKAKHLAAVEEAKGRQAAAQRISGAYSAGSASASYSQQFAVTAASPPAPVQDTVEVAAAKAQHLAAVAQASSRVAGGPSFASQYAVPVAAVRNPGFHYPNVPVEFPRFPAPAPTPLAAVHYNSIVAADEESGQYVPDDEGRYYPGQNDEGQYDARLDAEGQYDARLDAEGQYDARLNDEGQWVPSANEGQYVPDVRSGEDNMPYSYSYSDGLSSKTETKTADGITRGRYSYVDANGVLQAIEYQADNVNGFRAAGTNLPQPPAVAAVPVPVAAPARIYHPPAPVSSYSLAAPAYRAPVAAYGVPAVSVEARPVSFAVPEVPADTPEVAAAKAAHFAAHREAGARLASAYGR